MKPEYVAIIIAVISAGGTIIAAIEGRNNRKAIKPMKDILSNSSSVDSLDKIIITYRREFTAITELFEKRIKALEVELEECVAGRITLTQALKDSQVQIHNQENRIIQLGG